MRVLLEIFEGISTVTFGLLHSTFSKFTVMKSVVGFILNLLLLYLIRRFSSKELGTYKYLLEVFATYDTYLVVIHHVVNPVCLYTFFSGVNVFLRK